MTTSVRLSCKVCGEAIVRGSGASLYVHARHTGQQHVAQPELAHPADTDPFAQFRQEED